MTDNYRELRLPKEYIPSPQVTGGKEYHSTGVLSLIANEWYFEMSDQNGQLIYIKGSKA